MLACPRCATPNPPGTRFCSECGLSLEGVAARSAPAAVADPVGVEVGGTRPEVTAVRPDPLGGSRGTPIEAARPPDRAEDAPGWTQPPREAARTIAPPPAPVEAPIPVEAPADPPPAPVAARPKSAGTEVLKTLAAILFGIALLGVGYVIGSSTAPPAPQPATIAAPTATLSPQAAVRATIEADSRVQSGLAIVAGPNGLTSPVPWGGTFGIAPGAVTTEISATVDRLPDVPPDTIGMSASGPVRVFVIKAIQRSNNEPVPLFAGRVTLTGAGSQCLIHQGNNEFDPIESRSIGAGQVECAVPRPGIVAITR